MKNLSRLRRKIDQRAATVGVIGQGYVGLSLSAAVANAGMSAIGIDTDCDRIASLGDGRLDVAGVDEAQVMLAISTGRLSFSTDPASIAQADVVVICVPTPVADRRPDLSAMQEAGASLAPYLQSGTLVVLESTTYPGTTEQVLLPLLEAGGLRCGRDFLVAYSPERIDPGNRKFGLHNVPRIVGGVSQEATDAAAAFYDTFVESVHVVSSCRAAELAKLLENTFRMVNIALVNELAQLCAEQGIDTWEVIEAASTKPFGFMPFYPGPGVGGHCIPLDPAYLTWQSRRDTGRPYRLVETAMDINQAMPEYIVTRIGEALNERGRALRGARILCLGVTYKADVGDLRESAAVAVVERLHRKGADVRFHDPFVDRLELGGTARRRVGLTSAAVAASDCVALLTPHESYDLEWLLDRSELIFDARNALAGRRRSGVVVL